MRDMLTPAGFGLHLLNLNIFTVICAAISRVGGVLIGALSLSRILKYTSQEATLIGQKTLRL